MSTLAEIEAAMEKLPLPQQKQLFQHLVQWLEPDSEAKGKRRLPLVPATGCPITQREIDDALDAD